MKQAQNRRMKRNLRMKEGQWHGIAMVDINTTVNITYYTYVLNIIDHLEIEVGRQNVKLTPAINYTGIDRSITMQDINTTEKRIYYELCTNQRKVQDIAFYNLENIEKRILIQKTKTMISNSQISRGDTLCIIYEAPTFLSISDICCLNTSAEVARTKMA